jgi:dTDP-4-amino-4,6-dideoxygalactose transaminase
VHQVRFLDLRAASEELAADLEAAASRVVRSGWYVLGPEVERFEAEFAAYVGVRHCIGVGNGLDALRIALAAMGVGPGDEVIVPANTYIATWLAVTAVGARPVPVDADRVTCNLDPNLVAERITPRTRAIIPVHLYGRPAPMGEINAVAARHGLAVLEDAAQAHGASLDGMKVGGLGHAAAWSFFPSKNLGALGDGGAVTTDDDGMAERVRMLRNYGSRVKYVHEVPGANSRLDELQAAVLSVKLRQLDDWNGRRGRVAARYLEGLAGGDVILPAGPSGSQPVWHLFVVRAQDRDGLQHHLASCGIETLIHYPIPPYRQGAYAGGLPPGGPPLPVSDRLHATVLSLPIGPHLSEADVDRVIDGVATFAVRPERAAEQVPALAGSERGRRG